MNRASIDFAWTRKSGGSPTGLSRIARKGRARTGFALPAALIIICILLVASRATSTTHSPAYRSFQEAGHLSCQKQMKDNYEVFLRLLNDKQRQINELRLRQGQLPGVMK